MEQKTPHCKLAIVRQLIAANRVSPTFSATQGAAALGFDVPAMIAVVAALQPGDFDKSMTTYADHRIWQDVYKPMTDAGGVYLKLTIIEEVLIVSFKEL